MERYYFDVCDGIDARDATGTSLPNLEAARRHAMQVAADFTMRPGMLSEQGGAVMVTVRTAENGAVLSVRLAFSVETSKPRRNEIGEPVVIVS